MTTKKTPKDVIRPKPINPAPAEKTLVIYYVDVPQSVNVQCAVHETSRGNVQLGRFSIPRDGWNTFMVAFDGAAYFKPMDELP